METEILMDLITNWICIGFNGNYNSSLAILVVLLVRCYLEDGKKALKTLIKKTKWFYWWKADGPRVGNGDH